MNLSQAQTMFAILASTATFTTAMIATVRGVARKYFAPVLQVVDDWKGDPGRPDEGIAPRDSVLKRLTRVETASVETRADMAEFRDALRFFRDDLATVKSQVTTNGGNSMLDRVNQIAANTQNGQALKEAA